MNTSESFPAFGAGFRPANNPNAAAAARARLATLPDPHRNPSTPAQTAPLPLAKPVSPAAQHLKGIAGARRSQIRQHLPSRIQPILTAVGVFLLILALFKAPVIITQLTFHQPAKIDTSSTSLATAGETVPPQPLITIPKISVNAPVIEPATMANAPNYDPELENGVVHYPNTAFPGQAGNTVIFGHSSNDWWQPGNYKFVFVLLDKLSVGDRLSLNYNSHRYIYEVTDTRVVEPTDVSVLSPTAAPTLTLITCTPPGTSWKRFIVTGKQISPDPSGAQLALPSSTPTTTGITLPSGAPSFTNQVTQLLGGMKDAFLNLLNPNRPLHQTPIGTPPALLPSAV